MRSLLPQRGYSVAAPTRAVRMYYKLGWTLLRCIPAIVQKRLCEEQDARELLAQRPNFSAKRNSELGRMVSSFKEQKNINLRSKSRLSLIRGCQVLKC
tara:strand:- start:916 stop:1209 length:294 start_codon:yes stop_codon:yes gene_type:complete